MLLNVAKLLAKRPIPCYVFYVGICSTPSKNRGHLGWQYFPKDHIPPPIMDPLYILVLYLDCWRASWRIRAPWIQEKNAQPWEFRPSAITAAVRGRPLTIIAGVGHRLYINHTSSTSKVQPSRRPRRLLRRNEVLHHCSWLLATHNWRTLHAHHCVGSSLGLWLSVIQRGNPARPEIVEPDTLATNGHTETPRRNACQENCWQLCWRGWPVGYYIIHTSATPPTCLMRHFAHKQPVFTWLRIPKIPGEDNKKHDFSARHYFYLPLAAVNLQLCNCLLHHLVAVLMAILEMPLPSHFI